MIARLMGLLTIVTILAPLVLGAATVVLARDILTDIENAAAARGQAINDELDGLRSTVNTIRIAFNLTANRLQPVVDALDDFRDFIDDIPTGITFPGFSWPVLAVGPFSLTIPAIPSLNISAPGFSDVVDFLEDSYEQFGRVASGLQRILNIGDFAESAQRLAAETAGLAQDVGEAFTTRAGPLRTLLTALAVWLGLVYIVLLYERLARGWRLLMGRP
ncbi:MAG: hypothetical protein IT323_15920 [Anaerolineae bacterium]|nr:hypothetical protein [Anaerolineae bacterium]